MRIARALGVTADELLRVDSALPKDEEWDPKKYIKEYVDKLTDIQADNIADTMREYIALSKRLHDDTFQASAQIRFSEEIL